MRGVMESGASQLKLRSASSSTRDGAGRAILGECTFHLMHRLCEGWTYGSEEGDHASKIRAGMFYFCRLLQSEVAYIRTGHILP